MRRARHLWVLPVLSLFLSVGGPPPPPGNSYVDTRLCATCHSNIARTYALTGMARSFYSLPPGFTGGDPFYHEKSGTWYATVKQGDGYYQRRWRVGNAGQEIHAQELRIDYVMGSGNHVRTFLHRTQRGALIELPLAWYPENGGTWAMNPGYDRDYTPPARTISYECMFCHNAYPSIPPGHDAPGSEPLFAGVLPQGIDCQRCHGPGGDHVRAAQTGGDLRATIVNPARLSPDRQIEVCLQCHLETTSLELPHSIVKYDRGPFSYRPGEPLGGFMIAFDRAPGGKHENNFEIAHSAYRLRKSQCFLRSAGKLTCTTCHNPHDIPRGEAATLHYNGVCGSCHQVKHTADPNCISCHMPKRRTQDVVHAVMTDHLIQRRAPPGDLLAPLAERPELDEHGYRGEVVPYYPARLPQTAENALYVAVAQVAQRSNLAKGLPRLSAEIVKTKPARAEFYVQLGQAWLAAGKPLNAIGAFEEAVKREPRSAAALLNLADALTEAGQPARAIGVLNRAVNIAPDETLLWYQLGLAHWTAGQETEAIRALERSIACDPDVAESHNVLGSVLASQGDLNRAEKEVLTALQINPDFPEALGNLGHLLAARGDLTQAAFYFARSVQLKPNDAEVRTNYAVALASLGQFEEAQRQIDAAVGAGPKFAEAHNFRGTLLDRAGKHDEALAEFLEAVRLRPDFALAHRNVARILEAKGEHAAAQRHLRQADHP